MLWSVLRLVILFCYGHYHLLAGGKRLFLMARIHYRGVLSFYLVKI